MTPLFKKFLGINWILMFTMAGLLTFGVYAIFNASSFREAQDLALIAVPRQYTRAHPAAPDRAVALRVEPLRVSILRTAIPCANTARPALPALTRQRPVPVTGDRAL